MGDHPVQGRRHGRPRGPQGWRAHRGRQHLGPLRGRVRVRQRREALFVLPPHPRRRTTFRKRWWGRRGRPTCATAAGRSTGRRSRGPTFPPTFRSTSTCSNSIRAGKPLNELQNVAESTFTAILGRNASYACRTLKWDDALAANEDTMPKHLTLDASVPVNSAPTPGSWKLPPRA